MILAAYWVIQLTGQMTGPKDVPTSQVIALINSDAPLKEVVLTDTEQSIEITQADDKQTKVKATWVGTESQDIITRLNARVAAGTLESWKGVNPNLAVDPPVSQGAEWDRPAILVDFSGPDGGMLVARNGELLNALEMVTMEAVGDMLDEHDRISFDAMGFRQAWFLPSRDRRCRR